MRLMIGWMTRVPRVRKVCTWKSKSRGTKSYMVRHRFNSTQVAVLPWRYVAERVPLTRYTFLVAD